MALDLLPHVFEPFRQGEPSRATAGRAGTGAVDRDEPRGSARRHGGRRQRRSRSGATFIFYLPMALAEPRGADGFVASPGPVELGTILSGVRVLVVEDEEDARDVVHRLLEDAGAIVATAGSTAEALTARRMIARTCS